MDPTLTTPAATPSQPAAAAPATPSSPSTPAAAAPITPAAGSPPAPQQPQAPGAAVPAPPVPANLVSTASPAAPAIPEKFIVKKADGSIDHEATLTKALGSYTQLEKRFSSGDVPPETEAGYTLDYSAFPEGVKINPEGEKALLKSLHSAGMTNKQVQTVINKYGEVIKQGFEIQKQQEAERVTTTNAATHKNVIDVNAELKNTWGENFAANSLATVRGFNHLVDETDKADMDKIGYDAKATYRILMKVLAKVGAGITEDTQIVNVDGAGGLNETREALMQSKAYTDENDPAHKATVAKVTALYNKQWPSK